MPTLRAILGDERGSILVLVSVSLTAVLGMSAFAVDLAMLYSARSEAQQAADAAALAGASAFVDAAPAQAVAEAQQRALVYAKQNRILAAPITAAEVSVLVDDDDATVEVVIDRPAVPTMFARVFGVESVRVTARSVARATEVIEESCVKPFSPPDPAVDASGVLRDEIGFTRGDPLVLKGATGGADALPWDIRSHSWDGPCSSGGATHTGPAYRQNICNCNLAPVRIAAPYDLIAGASGNLVPHTTNGVNGLSAQDENAVWDVSTHTLRGSRFGNWRHSPRVVVVPLYNPVTSDYRLRFTRFVKVFVESTSGGEVYGRYVGNHRFVQLVN